MVFNLTNNSLTKNHIHSRDEELSYQLPNKNMFSRPYGGSHVEICGINGLQYFYKYGFQQ